MRSLKLSVYGHIWPPMLFIWLTDLKKNFFKEDILKQMILHENLDS